MPFGWLFFSNQMLREPAKFNYLINITWYFVQAQNAAAILLKYAKTSRKMPPRRQRRRRRHYYYYFRTHYAELFHGLHYAIVRLSINTPY